jgi:glycosyltransferase involved in cell wall biosynthesis
MSRHLLKVAFLGKIGPGGQEEQLARTAAAMAAHADVALVSDDPGIRISLEGFDVCHVFHAADGLCLARLQAGLRHRCVNAYSTIWWPPDETMEAATRLGLYSPEQCVGWCSHSRDMYAQFLSVAHVLLPNSRAEANEVMKVARGQAGSIFPVVNAVAPELLAQAEFMALPQGREATILCAGRLEPRKNQLALIQAFQLAHREGWRLALAGSLTHDPRYAEMCERAARDWPSIQFWGELAQPALWAAMARAAVYAQPSFAETPGLASMEAGMLGCALICGGGSAHECFGPFSDCCEPARVAAIADVLAACMAQGPLTPDQQAAQRDHLAQFSWRRAALQTVGAYLQAMLGQPDWRQRLARVTVRTDSAIALFSGAGAWDTGGGQRTTQIARALERAGHLVVFVQRPAFPRGLMHDFCVAQELQAAELLDCIDAERRLAIIAVPYPEYAAAAQRLKERGWTILYDMLDDWEGFREIGQGDWYDRAAEVALVGTADANVATSALLEQRARGFGADGVARVPNGYAPVPAAAGGGRRLARGSTTVAYVGTLYGNWLDWAVIAAICDARPAWAVNLIGPDRPASAPTRPNLCYIGAVLYEEVGALLRQADVGIVPFRPGRVAAAVSPVKVYDYLAAGLPVVADASMQEVAHLP